MSVLPESGDQVTIKLFAPTPLSLTGTLRTLANLGLPVVEELALPLPVEDTLEALALAMELTLLLPAAG